MEVAGVIRVTLVHVSRDGHQRIGLLRHIDPTLVIRDCIVSMSPSPTPIPGNLEGGIVSWILIGVRYERIGHNQFPCRESSHCGDRMYECPLSLISFLPGQLCCDLDWFPQSYAHLT